MPREKDVGKKMSSKCTCSMPKFILGAILLTIGIWLLVAGFTGQFTDSQPMLWIVGEYFVGILFAAFGKWMVKMAFCSCAVHGMCGKK